MRSTWLTDYTSSVDALPKLLEEIADGKFKDDPDLLEQHGYAIEGILVWRFEAFRRFKPSEIHAVDSRLKEMSSRIFTHLGVDVSRWIP